MLPEDVLLMMAQLGVAIAGFNGVATALSHGERRNRGRGLIGSILITASAAVTLWSVIPLVLLTTAIDPSLIWRGSSLGWAVYQVGVLLFRARQARRLGFTSSPLANVFRLLSLVAVVLQIWNGFVLGAAWPHIVGVSTSLVIAIASFFVLFHEDAGDA
jgi:hypothetical protein